MMPLGRIRRIDRRLIHRVAYSSVNDDLMFVSRADPSLEESRYEKKYLLELSEQVREYLHKLISSGTAPARKSNRVRILLKVDVTGKHAEAKALSDRQIARMLE